MWNRVAAVALVVGATVVGLGCREGATAGGDPTVVTAVTPPGGAVDVDPAGLVMITFSRPMQKGMEMYAALHEGDVTGPEVTGTWSWAEDGLSLQFAPAAPLANATLHTIHLGGGMVDGRGDVLGLESCVVLHGGQWATEGMMGGGMMAGQDMMGSGWRGGDGTYGMLFGFTTK